MVLVSSDGFKFSMNPHFARASSIRGTIRTRRYSTSGQRTTREKGGCRLWQEINQKYVKSMSEKACKNGVKVGGIIGGIMVPNWTHFATG